MKMDGTELSARFALPPNSRAYCGKPSFRKAFAAFLADRRAANRMALERELSKFTAHYAYLRLIASASGLSPFDKKVAEALWIGNGLLEKVRIRDLRKILLQQFCGKGMLPKSRAKRLAESLPGGFAPHHSFHVLYLHTISGVIEPSVENADSCRVSWGKVIRAGSGFVEVATQRLAKENGRLLLLPVKKRWKTSCAGVTLLDKPKAGDVVASHWGIAVMELAPAQVRRLEKFTEINLKAANSE